MATTVSLHFWTPGFCSHQTYSPSPVRHTQKGFRIVSNIRGVFAFAIDSPVYSPPGSRPKLVYKRALLLQNILGSQDSSMINILGSLDSLVYYILFTRKIFCKPVLMLVQSTLISRFPSEFTTGQLRLTSVFIIRESRPADVLIHRGIVFDTRESFY